MGRRWRRRLLGAAAVAAVAILCIWGYHRVTALGRWVPGTYTAISWDGKGTTTLRLGPDGSAVWENYVPAGAAAPSTRFVGRWRLSGRVLLFETGAKAAAPVGVFQPLFERFDSPLQTQEMSRSRVVSADPSGLTLDLDGVEWRLQRVGPDAEPGAAPDRRGMCKLRRRDHRNATRRTVTSTAGASSSELCWNSQYRTSSLGVGPASPVLESRRCPEALYPSPTRF
jgi:hypothetical protein